MRPQAFVFVILTVLTVVSCGRDRNPIVPKQPVVGNEIIFTSNRDDGLPDLYTTNVDGTGLHRLSADSLYDYEPRWSPNGTKIAFIHQYSSTGDSANVTVMDVDGTNRTRLTVRYHVEFPSWSPDGSQISFQSGPGQRNQLWVMNADGSGAHVLIDEDSLNGVWEISWTPKNTFIGTDGLGLMQFDADGGNRTQIVPLINVGYAYPRMSPDGSKIVFAWSGPYWQGGYPYNIYVVNADGTGLKQLTDNVNDTGNPVWSPDGSKIAFTGPSATLWTMNVDGSNQKQIQLPSDATQPYDYIGDWK